MRQSSCVAWLGDSLPCSTVGNDMLGPQAVKVELQVRREASDGTSQQLCYMAG
jgi:hypothetical protein